jgi:DNA-directed RNA polymerase subunit M/transcription elongation factor TFIIS
MKGVIMDAELIFAEDVEVCPKCGKATNEVELIYPRTDEQDERRERAFICQNCLYVFSESDA